jgi:mRNA-degrading endonuclease YafQ of YafQ-DinJ toxin-antitoxin module
VPELAIPKEHERGIVVIKHLSDSDLSQISETFEKLIPPIKSSDVVSALQPILSALSKEDIENLIDTVYSLYFLRSDSDVSLQQFLADLMEAIKESDNKEIRTTNAADLSKLESSFKSLLTVRSLSTLTKAHDLRGDFANIFWDAKMISDIRPVWDEDVKVPPEGVVITHTLKLKYGDIESAKELYLSMNENDIELLISVLVRAQQKRATLEFLAKESWMKILHG